MQPSEVGECRKILAARRKEVLAPGWVTLGLSRPNRNERASVPLLLAYEPGLKNNDGMLTV